MTESGEVWFGPGAALVIGGTGALGRAVSEMLAQRGTDVAFTYRSQHQAAQAIAAAIEHHGRSALSRALDLANTEALRRLFEETVARFGTLHSLIYAVGSDIGTDSLEEVDPGEWRAAIETDVNGFFDFARTALPVLRRQGFGSVTAVTTAAVGRVPPRDVLSAAPKAAVEVIVKTIAREEGRNGIRANCVAPGWIGAGVGARMMERGHLGDPTRILKTIPLRRIGTPADVAEAVTFLASRRANFITGQTLAVDGGWQI